MTMYVVSTDVKAHTIGSVCPSWSCNLLDGERFYVMLLSLAQTIGESWCASCSTFKD